MILSDRSINEAIASGRLGIDPFDPKLVQPSSIDVRLDNKFLVFRNTKRAFIDVKQPADDLMEMIEVGHDEPMFLHPHEFVLGSTVERVKMPDDLVGRLEGRSSLGRLGVVIHSSLPYDSPVLFRDKKGVLDWRPIGELVEKRLPGSVVGFDRSTFEVGFHDVTNWFTEPPDKIYEVRLASGRRVHVTAGHNLFTVDSRGDLVKTPTRALGPGTRVAIPKWIPDPTDEVPEYRPLDQLSVSYYVRTRTLPLPILKQVHGAVPAFAAGDRFRYRGGASTLPAVIRVDRELAWLLGLYVAQGYGRYLQLNIANTDQEILDRAQAALEALEQHVSRHRGGITCCSVLASALFDGLGMGDGASSKRLPRGALGWPWQTQANRLCGFSGRTLLNVIEKDPSRGSVRVATLERLHGAHARPAPSVFSPLQKLTRLVTGDLLWDEVIEVVDTGRFETVYDLEVRPKGAHIENFLAGHGGIFVSNTAGFIDASFEGHVTLEISNLANLPIALYPGMRIGQISFSLMTTPADRPYGAARGSKYSGQQLPTASRLYLDFQP